MLVESVFLVDFSLRGNLSTIKMTRINLMNWLFKLEYIKIVTLLLYSQVLFPQKIDMDKNSIPISHTYFPESPALSTLKSFQVRISEPAGFLSAHGMNRLILINNFVDIGGYKKLESGGAKTQIISHFQALCGKLINVEIADANNSSKKFDLNKYSPYDRIIVIGPNASKVLRFLKETHSKCNDLFSSYFLTDVNTQVYYEKLNEKNTKKMNQGAEVEISVEIGDGFWSDSKENYFSVAGMMNESQFNYYENQLRASSIPELIGFLSVHIIGHNALGGHVSEFVPNFYMSKGSGLVHYMHEKDPSGNYYKSELKDLFNYLTSSS